MFLLLFKCPSVGNKDQFGNSICFQPRLLFLPSANYLYADNLDMKFPGMPLVYKTRYHPPVSKCLQFWYFMDGVDNKLLAVNFHQEQNIHKQLLRIRGNQGSSWKRARVPLEPHIKMNGNPFYVRNIYHYVIYKNTLNFRIPISSL